MKRFIINNNNLLYDIECFGLDKMSVFMTQQFIDVEDDDSCYLVIWQGSLEAFDEPAEERIKLEIVDSFDTIEEVKEHYNLSAEPEEINFWEESIIGFMDSVIVTKK